MRLKDAVFVLAMVMTAGCGGGRPDDAPESGGPAKNAAKPQPPPLQPPGAETELEEAKAGVGKKGRGYGTGPVATPIATMFITKQRVVFEIQIPSAMKLYKAQHGLPKTHEEFMEKIIKANSIRLPELPDGEQYIYVPEKGKLMKTKAR